MLSFPFSSPGMRVYVRLAAHLRSRVGGLCGNFDGDAENDFTTRQGIEESTAELFGNSWKVSPSCPDVADQDLRDPCSVSAAQTRAHLHICWHLQEHKTHIIYLEIAKANLSFFVPFSWTLTGWPGPGKGVQSWLRICSLGVIPRCLSSSIMTGVSLTLAGEWQRVSRSWLKMYNLINFDVWSLKTWPDFTDPSHK